VTSVLKPPAAAEPAQGAGAAQDTAKAARMLEAYFLRRVLAEVRESSDGGMLQQGFGGQVFREMFDEALADRMADGGGVGLAKVVEQQLLGDERARAGAPVEPAAGARALRAAYQTAGERAPTMADLGQIRAVPVDHATGIDPSAGTGVSWKMPLDPERISSGFGKVRVDPSAESETHLRQHKGLDMTAPMGAPVSAARAGTVIRAGESTGGFGNVVVIDHGEGLHSYYGHLSSVDVPVGTEVAAGAHIGKVGSTGRSSGPHLHFEVRKHGVSVDPTTDIEGLKIGIGQPNR
jgi:murein DD-endopeptidase MepM/ murein hydrolase activator NlpD